MPWHRILAPFNLVQCQIYAKFLKDIFFLRNEALIFASLHVQYELYMKRVTELQATTQERNKYRKGILDTQKRRTHEFTAAFQLISDKVR